MENRSILKDYNQCMDARTTLDAWKLKNRIHAGVLMAAGLGSVAYILQQQLLWPAAWRLFVLLQIHQHLMTFTHRLMFHQTRGITWKSPLLTFGLRNWMVPFWPEGFECIRAAHDTTQRSQRFANQCLSESMLWFSPQYMKIDRRDFVTKGYMARQTLLQFFVYGSAIASWQYLSTELRLWTLLTLCVAPVLARVLMYRGHSFLHSPQETLLQYKSQNFTSLPYDRQAYNLGFRGSRFLSKYVLGFLGLGDHLHNNHHHDPNALCQAHTPDELDGAYFYFRVFHRLGLLRIRTE